MKVKDGISIRGTNHHRSANKPITKYIQPSPLTYTETIVERREAILSPQKYKQKMRQFINHHRVKTPKKYRKRKESKFKIIAGKKSTEVSGRETFWWGKIFEKKYGLESTVKMTQAETDLQNQFALHFCSCNDNDEYSSYLHYKWGHVLETYDDIDSAFVSKYIF